MEFISSALKREIDMSTAYQTAAQPKDELIQKHMLLVKKLHIFIQEEFKRQPR